MAKRKKPPAGTVRVEFDQMKEGSGGTRLPEDDYVVKIKSVKQTTFQSGNSGLVFELVVADGKFKGKTVTDRIVLTPKTLWRLRDMLEAIGMEVPRKAINLPLKKLTNKTLGVTLTDGEPYNGRIKSEVSDYISPEAVHASGDDDDLDDLDRDELKQLIKDEELDVKVRKSMSDEDIVEAIREARGDDEDDLDEDDEDEDLDDEDEDEDEDGDELDEMDRAELKAHIKSEGLDVKVKKSMSDDDLREAIRAASEDEDDEDEDEDEEEEGSRKASTKTKNKAGAKKKGKKKSDDEDIEDLDLDEL